MIEELVGRVFTTRNISHLQHFSTKSYAQHMALGAFYDGVIDALDTLVEAYQGQFALLGTVEFPTPEVTDIIDHLQEEADWIESNREEISGGSSSVGNLVDSLVAVYLSAIYKLTHLK